MYNRIAYIVYDELGNIHEKGICVPKNLPIVGNGYFISIISFSNKLVLDNFGAQNLFVSMKPQDLFELLFCENGVFIYKKNEVQLVASKTELIIEQEHVTITHNAPSAVRLWRDLHQPLIPSKGGLVHPTKGIKITASIPGLYTVRIKHPRYRAKPIQIKAVISNGGQTS